ncbi:MAG: methyltransferase domain-containing protein [Chloroflexi bacterium]|nr:methyltransferase domain-containing protein [Chloroflexota bacterium]
MDPVTLAVNEVRRVLDLGCGAGRDAPEFARLGYKVTGLDLERNHPSSASLAPR